MLAFPSPPTDGAHPLDWARYYVSRGWVPLPIRSPQELEEYRLDRLAKHLEKGLHQPEAEARALSESQRAAKRPMISWREDMWLHARPDDAQLVEWWGEYPGRGIFLLTGRDAGMVVIDVDTYKGASPEPWQSLTGVVATTPKGGVHAYFAAADVKTSESEVAPGIDVRGNGGGVVAPSGWASPGRRFLRLEHLAVLLLPEQQRLPPDPRDPREQRADPRNARAGTFAEVVSTPRPDGTKVPSMKTIVGMLCRPRPLPEDGIEAVRQLVADWLGGDHHPNFALVWSGMEGALRSPEPRSRNLTVQIGRLWNLVRCNPQWDEDHCDNSFGSVWDTAARAEAPDQATATIEQAQAQSQDYLQVYAPSAAQLYGAAEIRVDSQRELLSCAMLPRWLKPLSSDWDPEGYGHGWGPWLDEAIGGGVCPGFFWVLGARRAKAGKTAFLDQVITGLSMLGASSMMNLLEAPIILTFVLSEMPYRGLEHRRLSRYLGIDQSVLRRGTRASEAPGVRHLSRETGRTPASIAEDIFKRAAEAVQMQDVFQRSRELTYYINVRTFPEDQRRGPKMLRFMAGVIRGVCARVSYQLGRTDIWPSVVIDPLQRYTLDRGDDGVQALDAMLEECRYLTDEEGWILACTSDTQKDSAKMGKLDANLPPDVVVASVFRGSYKMNHIPDLTMAIEGLPLSSGDLARQQEFGLEYERTAQIVVGLSRWSAGSDLPIQFRWRPRSGRFYAVPPAGAAQAPSAQPPPSGSGPQIAISKPGGRRPPKGQGGKFQSPGQAGHP